MRGGSLLIAALAVCLPSCSSPAPAEEKVVLRPAAPAPPTPEALPPPREPAYRFPAAEPPSADPQGSAIKGQPGVAPVKADAPNPKPPPEDPVLALQKEAVARNPGKEEERLRLALLYAAAGRYEEAAEALGALRTRAHRMLPAVEYFLKRQLGDHKEADRLLAQLRQEGQPFAIERAALCTSVRRFRDYVAAESDHVKPGGRILIYVEPRHFALQRQQERHILHLKYEWKLVDDRSVEVPVPAWDQAPPGDREDRNTYLGPIEEFYQSFALPLPANLAMGHYRVRVTVTDAHSGKSDRVSIPIYVTAVEKSR